MRDAETIHAAPAKINLALHVTGRRDDGFHLLETMVDFTGFGDRIAMRPAAADDFAVEGPFAAGLSAGSDNLVVRAREALRAAFPGVAARPVDIRLAKMLPVASGIGGGSSDAAATLAGLAAHWAIEDADGRLTTIAAGLGADVPMCLTGRPLVARGIGHDIETVSGWPALPLALVNPGIALATPRVFGALARHDNGALPALPRRRDIASVVEWLASCRNDLEMAAISLAPPVAETLALLRDAGARLARMSGSGATCFGVFADRGAAEDAASTIAARRPDWFVAATTTKGSSQ